MSVRGFDVRGTDADYRALRAKFVGRRQREGIGGPTLSVDDERVLMPARTKYDGRRPQPRSIASGQRRRRRRPPIEITDQSDPLGAGIEEDKVDDVDGVRR